LEELAQAPRLGDNASARGAGSTGSAASHAHGHGFTLREINAVGGNKNCSSCAIATDQLLSGNPVSAVNLPNVRSVFPQDLANTLGRDWHGASKGVLGKLLNERDLRKLVPNAGDRGIVYGYRGPGVEAHYFNVVNQNGTIRFLDGQAGTAQNMSSFQYFMYMGTN
jgi:filamentous hemagglutinin